MSESLLTWYHANARRLPWRAEPRSPYHVLVSEIMLQQTQVDRVAPRFPAFVDRFPDVETLASAEIADVLSAWSGLGYYRRGRLLHQLAGEIAVGGGAIPDSVEELQALPGIGPYTAAAVASLAFGVKVPVLDGNVMRVGTRVLALDEDSRSARARKQIGKWVRAMFDNGPAGVVNEALMELGATVCRPVAPHCDRCPLQTACAAHRMGSVESFPRPRRRRRMVNVLWVAGCLVDETGSWLVRQVEEGPILEGLWLPPFVEIAGDDEPLSAIARVLPQWLQARATTTEPEIRHTITHRRIVVRPIRFEVVRVVPASPGWKWIDPARPGVPTSTLFSKLVTALRM